MHLYIILLCSSFIRPCFIYLQKIICPEFVSLFLQQEPIFSEVFILHIIPFVAPWKMLQLCLGGEHTEIFTLIGTQLQPESTVLDSVLGLILCTGLGQDILFVSVLQWVCFGPDFNLHLIKICCSHKPWVLMTSKGRDLCNAIMQGGNIVTDSTASALSLPSSHTLKWNPYPKKEILWNLNQFFFNQGHFLNILK